MSVIMCVFNGERYLAQALESVAAQHANLELVLVDDGSTDDTATVARRTGTVRYIYQDNAGLPAARNTGIEAAKGDLVAFLDADDWWATDKTDRQLKLLRSNPDVDVVLGHTRRTWLGEAGDDLSTDPELALSLCAGLIRRPVFDRVGRFDESLRYCDDWDWFMRAREAGVTVATHPDTVLFYRRHESNMTNDLDAGNRDFARMLKASLDRRRRAGDMDLGGHRELE